LEVGVGGGSTGYAFDQVTLEDQTRETGGIHHQDGGLESLAFMPSSAYSVLYNFLLDNEND